jgi:hypothetical protein
VSAGVVWPHEEPTVAGVFDWRASVGRRIAAYRPAAVAEPVWERIAEPVRDAVARAEPATPRQAGQMCSVLSALALFADRAGYEAKAEVWLSAPVLEGFAWHGMCHAAASSRVSVLARLHALAGAVIGNESGVRTMLADRDTHRPYHPAELTALWQAAAARDAVRGGIRSAAAGGAGRRRWTDRG